MKAPWVELGRHRETGFQEPVCLVGTCFQLVWSGARSMINQKRSSVWIPLRTPWEYFVNEYKYKQRYASLSWRHELCTRLLIRLNKTLKIMARKIIWETFNWKVRCIDNFFRILQFYDSAPSTQFSGLQLWANSILGSLAFLKTCQESPECIKESWHHKNI